MDDFETLADNIGKYVMEKYVKPYLSLHVSFYRASVSQAASGGKITVCRPYDNPVALPYVTSAAGLQVGDQCIVLQLGSSSNCIVLGDGMLSNL